MSNIYHMAEPETPGLHDICIGGIRFGERFQDSLALQARLAFEDHNHLTVWISLSDGTGTDRIITLIHPQPQQLTTEGMNILSRLLLREGNASEQISPERLNSLRDAGVNTVHAVPSDIGAITRIQLAPEVSQLGAHLWLACRAENGRPDQERRRAEMLAQVLAGHLDREVDLYQRERTQQADQRMANLAQQIADIFAAPGVPISGRFRAMLDTCCSAFDMEKAYVTLKQDDGPHLKFSDSRMNVEPSEDTTPLGAARFSDLLMQDTTTLALEAVDRSRYADLMDITGAPTGRFLGCPIRFDGLTHGTIELAGTSAAPRPYTQSECAMLRTLSIYAAGPLVLLGQSLSY